MSVGEFFGWFAAAVFCGFLVTDLLFELQTWATRPRRKGVKRWR